MNYTYDNAGELREGLSFTSGNAGVNSENYKFGYDVAQNMKARTNDVTVTTYTVNNLNQVTGDGSFTGTYWHSDMMPGDHWYPCPPNISFDPKNDFNPGLPGPCLRTRRIVKTTPDIDQKVRNEAKRRADDWKNQTPYGLCSNNCHDYANSLADYAQDLFKNKPLGP